MSNNYLKLTIMNKKYNQVFATISVLVFCLILIACDPSFTTTFNYKNNTNDSILLYLYGNNKVDNDTVILQPQSKKVILNKNTFGGPTILSYEIYDSVVISKKYKILTYTKSSQDLNTIYDIDNWEVKKNGKYNYEYTYTFSENDFQ